LNPNVVISATATRTRQAWNGLRAPSGRAPRLLAFVKDLLTFLRLLTLLLLFAGSLAISDGAITYDFELKSDEAISPRTLKQFRDPATTEDDFLELLTTLPSIADEPASVWGDIVADAHYDAHYDARRRRLALAVLIRRHVKERMSLSDLAHLIPRNNLINSGEVKTRDGAQESGRPRFWSSAGVYFVRLFADPTPAPYGAGGVSFTFVLDRKGRKAKALLVSALRGRTSPKLNEIRLLDLKPVFEFFKFGPIH